MVKGGKARPSEGMPLILIRPTTHELDAYPLGVWWPCVVAKKGDEEEEEEQEEVEEEERHLEEGKEDFQQETEWEETYDLYSSNIHSLFVKHLQEINLY